MQHAHFPSFLRRTIAICSVTCFAAAPAVAASYCVNTSSELLSALNASAASLEDDSIAVESGAYTLNANVTIEIRGNLSLRGGYNPGCLSRSISPANTQIGSAPSGAFGMVLSLRDGDLLVEQFTFNRIDGLVVIDTNSGSAVTGLIKLSRNRFFVNGSGPLIRGRSKDVRVENNLITASVLRSLQVQTNLATAAISTDVIFNTVLEGQEGVRITSAAAAGTSRLMNNIIRDATGAELVVDGFGLFALNNHYGSTSFANGGSLAVNTQNSTADPLLDGSTFVPLANSPAINSGTNTIFGGIPSLDLVGGLRKIGSRPDRGAFESLISDITSLTVTSTANSGAGTLRQAILEANLTTTEETINFNISGGCPRIISLSTLLPTITSSLTIDGFTQPGSSANTGTNTDNSVHCVVLVGESTRTLQLSPAADEEITIRGLAFYRSTDTAIDANGSGKVNIEGNTFNTGVSLIEPNVPAYGIKISGSVNAIVGGLDISSRNVIGRASVAGIQSVGGGPNIARSVANNFIGASKSLSNVGNAVGVLVVDGYAAINDNTIGFSDAQGIRVEGANARVFVQRNSIGITPGNINPLPNGGNGIRLLDGSGHLISGNRIRNNGADGLVALTAVKRSNFLTNSFLNNAGLAIDLSPDGVNPIDTDTNATGANNGQNYPRLISFADVNNTEFTVSGNLSTANGTYLLQFFTSNDCGLGGFGNARSFQFERTLTISNGTSSTDGSADFSYTFDLDGRPNSNGTITAIATASDSNPSGGGSSELSNCITLVQDSLFADGFE
jgi:hypothetical protein